MEKKDLYLSDERLKSVLWEEHKRLAHTSITQAISQASADYAVKKVIELMESKGILVPQYFRSDDKLCIQNWQALKKLIET